jgi:5,10-methylenetetrahydromethanopterin reductase
VPGIALSLGISPRQALQDWSAQAAQLESEGVGRIWLIDSQLAMKDVHAGLTLAALNTGTTQLGPGVTNPLTRHPTVTASAMAALSELSDGRALLGLGAGDSAVYGLGWRPARVAQVEQALDFFTAILAGREATWEGRAYRLPHLAHRVPIHLAASQRRMCMLAGRLADGVILMGPADPVFVSRQVSWVEEGLQEAQRSRAGIEINLMVTLSARADSAQALDDVRSWASTEARLVADFADLPPGIEAYRQQLDQAKAGYDFAQHLSTHAAHKGAVSDELAARLAVAGTPAECAARLAELQGTGIDSWIFPLLGAGRLERLRVLRDQVLATLPAPG